MTSTPGPEGKSGLAVEQTPRLSSSELITVLKTFPAEFYPEFLEIILDSKTQEQIIPNSTATFQWRSWNEVGMFIPDSLYPLSIRLPKDPQEVEAINRALLTGNRPETIIYKDETNFYAEASPFGTFINKELVEHVINGSYQIKRINLAITTDTGVIFKREADRQYSVDLRLQWGLPLGDKLALKNWYSALPCPHLTGQTANIKPQG